MICSVNAVRSVNTKFLSVREILSIASFSGYYCQIPQSCSLCQDRHIPSALVSSVNNWKLSNICLSGQFLSSVSSGSSSVVSVLAVTQFYQFLQFLSSISSSSSSVLSVPAVPQFCQLWHFLSHVSSSSSSFMPALEVPQPCQLWQCVSSVHRVYITLSQPWLPTFFNNNNNKRELLFEIMPDELMSHGCVLHGYSSQIHLDG